MKSIIDLIVTLSLITIFNFTLTSSVLAGTEITTEIYKWTDKEGRVHYAARPGDSSAKKMHLGSSIFHERDKDDKKTDANKKLADERDKLCQDSKDTLEKYKKAPFLYRYDEQLKQKVRLTEKEHKETFLQAEKDVSYWCNPPQNSETSDDEKK